MTDLLPADYQGIHGDIVSLLESARRAAACSVNLLMTATYWEIGRRIVVFEQRGEGRAGYGQQLLKRLSADLSARFGRGFGVVNLQQMRLFFLAWPVGQICQTPSDKSLSAGKLLTPSAISAGTGISESLLRHSVDLPAPPPAALERIVQSGDAGHA